MIEALENQDKTALTAMFSMQAISEAVDFENGLDYLFEFFQGEAKPLADNGGPIVNESIDNGQITKEYVSSYYVDTDQQAYLFLLIEYTVDTDHPDNVGLYTLRVIKAADEGNQFGYWQEMKIAGIYQPEE